MLLLDSMAIEPQNLSGNACLPPPPARRGSAKGGDRQAGAKESKS